MIFFKQITKNLPIHYKDRMFTIINVNLDKCQTINLFRIVKVVAVEHGVTFPKYAGFNWHPLGRDNQSGSPNFDNEWMMLVH